MNPSIDSLTGSYSLAQIIGYGIRDPVIPELLFLVGFFALLLSIVQPGRRSRLSAKGARTPPGPKGTQQRERSLKVHSIHTQYSKILGTYICQPVLPE